MAHSADATPNRASKGVDNCSAHQGSTSAPNALAIIRQVTAPIAMEVEDLAHESMTTSSMSCSNPASMARQSAANSRKSSAVKVRPWCDRARN